MISYLRLTNFRRHENTELVFPDTAQTILISGANGAGKSSVVEAINYAFWGESRHGKRNLDSLVRRGAEYEGLEVEIHFTVLDVDYKIVRRRDTKLSTAVLFANDIALMEGARQVSAEVSRIFSLDSVGFRLAVLAQQKELDALQSLTPARRSEQVARLLRLDAISTAKDKARAKYRVERQVVESLGSAPDIKEMASRVEKLEQDLAGVAQEARAARESLTLVDAELAATQNIEDIYRQALDQVARCEGALTSAQQETARLTARLESVVIPPVPPQAPGTVDELSKQVSAVEKSLHEAETIQQKVQDRAVRVRELDEITSRQQDVEKILAQVRTVSDIDIEAKKLDVEAKKVTDALTQLTKSRNSLNDEKTRLQVELSNVVSLLDETSQLANLCQTCGQPITKEHRHSRQTSLSEQKDVLQQNLANVTRSFKEANESIHRFEKQKDSLVESRQQLESSRVKSIGAARELDSLTSRRKVVQGIIDRLPSQAVDVDSLYEKLTETTLQLQLARQIDEQARERALALAKKTELESSVTSATEAVKVAVEALEDAQIDVELQAQFSTRQQLKQARHEEHEIVVALEKQEALLQERFAACKRETATARSLASRRAKHVKAGDVAASTAKLLAEVSDVMASKVGPALEGSVSSMLAVLSNNRFDSAQVDSDYNISVRDDDGNYYPLSEFSGGENDLIALAVRLALASITAERSAFSGPGFLILDECFGSQDAARRQSILTALRNLRATYGQVFLISHVGGLQDAADLVVELSTTPSSDSSVPPGLEVEVS